MKFCMHCVLHTCLRRKCLKIKSVLIAAFEKARVSQIYCRSRISFSPPAFVQLARRFQTSLVQIQRTRLLSYSNVL